MRLISAKGNFQMYDRAERVRRVQTHAKNHIRNYKNFSKQILNFKNLNETVEEYLSKKVLQMA